MRTEYQNLMYVLHHLVQVVYVAQYSAPTSARTPLPQPPHRIPPTVRDNLLSQAVWRDTVSIGWPWYVVAVG